MIIANLKRYNACRCENSGGEPSMFESADGEYVKFDELVEALPSASTNTGSPKFPSSTEVWDHVKWFVSWWWPDADIEELRSITEVAYKFIRRKYRAGA